MILHITAGAHIQLWIEVGKFPKDLAGALRHDVCEHVQAPAVRHAEDDFIDAVLAGSFNRQVQKRN